MSTKFTGVFVQTSTVLVRWDIMHSVTQWDVRYMTFGSP